MSLRIWTVFSRHSCPRLKNRPSRHPSPRKRGEGDNRGHKGLFGPGLYEKSGPRAARRARWVGRERDVAIPTGGKAVFDLDRLIADCHEAVAADPSHKGVREVVARAVSDPAAVVGGLGEPRRAEVQRLS